MIINNFKLSLYSKPLIPLLFCIAYEDAKNTEKNAFLHINAIIDKPKIYSITNAELKRCFYLVHDMPNDIQAIAKKTIKFVKVRYNGVTFQLNQIPPFWVDKNFEANWEMRKTNSLDVKKVKQWRQDFLREISYVKQHFAFFGISIRKDEINHQNKIENLMHL